MFIENKFLKTTFEEIWPRERTTAALRARARGKKKKEKKNIKEQNFYKKKITKSCFNSLGQS